MPEKFKIAVIGSGPGGISAASHAAELGESHVLLEATSLHSDTIQKYQKGKHVMAEPGILPLRSQARFEAGTREKILGEWAEDLEKCNTHVSYNTRVSAVEGELGNFRITAEGRTFEAEHIIVGIGVQGNPRRLGCPGEDAAFIQYQLDDPDEYHGERIIVVGAGDAAIENAVALARNNTVYIVNRRDEFARAKDGNVALITAAIEDRQLKCFYSTSVLRVDIGDTPGMPGALVLGTPTGEATVPVDRIIARLGAIPPRGLVESFGINFPNDDPNAIPALSTRYESNVKGIYIVGALGGYPLIKQAMNQGYEVVEYILGNDILPADHPLLDAKLKPLPYSLEVDDALALMQKRIPVFAEVNALMFRELMLDSNVLVPGAGETIFMRNDYTNSFFTILDGAVEIEIGPDEWITSVQGNFFGEGSLLSGRRRANTVRAADFCVLIETPRRTMNKLINSVDAVRRVLDQADILRKIQHLFAPTADIEELLPIVAAAKMNEYKPGEILFAEGDDADALHVIRTGSVTIASTFDGRENPTRYISAGSYVGEMGLLDKGKRSATVRATVRTETISIDSESFLNLIAAEPALIEEMQAVLKERIVSTATLKFDSDAGELMGFLMGQGLGESTDVLLIDESLCVGCDNCEVACAETHNGISRLNRRAGPTFANVHVPTSCRHCENPHCMKDCPPDAIVRATGGEVYIASNCIGCGNCEKNCPYGVISMAYEAPPKPGFWSWMLFGQGPGPGQQSSVEGAADPDQFKRAVKCDMCKDLPAGAACVRACPTGAALRISPNDFFELVKGRRDPTRVGVTT